MPSGIWIFLFAGISYAQSINITAISAFPRPPQPTFALGVKSQIVTYNASAAATSVYAAVKHAVTGHAKFYANDLQQRDIMPDSLRNRDMSSSSEASGNVGENLYYGHMQAIPVDSHIEYPTLFEPQLHNPHLENFVAVSSFKRAVAMAERSACQSEPYGAGLTPSPDTPAAWAASQRWSNQALSATTPTGYVQTFVNLNASNVAYGYLGNQWINAYNPNRCANLCNAISGCTAFNLYFEREPCLTPGPACPNPESTTAIKCAFWGGEVASNNAVNDGQYREEFHVLIGGSNGYSRYDGCTEKVYPGYSQPQYLGNATILAQPDCNGVDSYLGFDVFTQGPFDYNLCASACSALSAGNLALNPRAQTCQFFTTYLLYKNGVPLGQYCAMYSEYWSDIYATNSGQYDAQGNHYTISNSYSSYNLSDPGYGKPRCSWQVVPTQNTICISSSTSPASATPDTSSSSSVTTTSGASIQSPTTTTQTASISAPGYSATRVSTTSTTTSMSVPGYSATKASATSMMTSESASGYSATGVSATSTTTSMPVLTASTTKTSITSPTNAPKPSASTTKASSSSKQTTTSMPHQYGVAANTAAKRSDNVERSDECPLRVRGRYCAGREDREACEQSLSCV